MKLRYLFYSLCATLLPITAQASTVLNPPFGKPDQLKEPVYVFATIIQALLGIVGAGTLLIFIWGGFKLIFASGNEEKITSGRTTLIWAVIGLAVVLTSYSILQYTFNVLAQASAGGDAASGQ